MSELSGGADTLTIDGVSADTAGREATRSATPAKKVAINERFFMMLLPSKPKTKRLIGRSVVHGQHSAAGGVSIYFFHRVRTNPCCLTRPHHRQNDWTAVSFISVFTVEGKSLICG